MSETTITPPPGCCPVPPADYGSPMWDEHVALFARLNRDNVARAEAITAGTEPPFTDTARRVHGLRPDQPFPPYWLTMDPEADALRGVWRDADDAELRALGFCSRCGRAVRLEPTGRCVYTTCGHYRAQGDVRRMQRYLDELRARITPERRDALLAMLPGPA